MPDKFDEGERARITVLDQKSICSSYPLDVGTSIVMDMGGLSGNGYDSCQNRRTTQDVPESLTNFFSQCTPGLADLNKNCDGQSVEGCSLSADVMAFPSPARDEPAVDGELRIRWAGSCPRPKPCADDTYAVRIERVGMGWVPDAV